jgi:peptide/nickel transport system ATP-binding protein
MGLTYLFITHDLSVVRYICDRVAVMYVGKLVEVADAEELFASPRHPYTHALLAAVPDIDPHRDWLDETLSGEVADASKEIVGCPFAPRCRHAADICREREPALTDGADDGGHPHHVACHRWRDIDLDT